MDLSIVIAMHRKYGFNDMLAKEFPDVYIHKRFGKNYFCSGERVQFCGSRELRIETKGKGVGPSLANGKPLDAQGKLPGH